MKVGIPESDIGPSVRFKRLFDVEEFKIISCVLHQFSRSGQLFDEGSEIMMITTIVV